MPPAEDGKVSGLTRARRKAADLSIVVEADLAGFHQAPLQSGAGALQAHDIRSRRSAQSTFIEFHLVVSGDMTVHQAHALCDRIEAALRQDIAGARVTIHVEPEHKAHAQGGITLES